MHEYHWMWIDLTDGIGDQTVLTNTIKTMESKGIRSIILNNGDYNSEQFDIGLTRILSFPRSGVPFLNTIISNYRVRKILEKLNAEEIPKIVMVNWRLIPGFIRAKKSNPGLENCKLVIEDRSPPVGSGMKTRLQWRFYDYSWKMAIRHVDAVNVLVPSLEEFVRNRFRIKRDVEFFHTPSGVDIDMFRPLDSFSSFNEGARLVYHGALDPGRGLHRIPSLIEKLESKGVRCKATIIGDGGLSTEFRKISDQNRQIDFLGRIPSNELPGVVANHDYGILPLPDSLEWTLGSPLKSMEFASSGLASLTTDVKGTEPFEGQNWITRADKDDPLEEWVESILNDIDFTYEFNQKRIMARQFALDNMTWESAMESLVKQIKEANI
jgi:glycosyltransferase involved in cell wall biosynthesis